jgi:hypothetical protein
VADGHKDYSGTPPWRKLGIRDHARVVTSGSPPDGRLWVAWPKKASNDHVFQGCQFVVRLRDRPR